MHRLTATDTPMVRYTRTIFPSYADQDGKHLKISKKGNKYLRCLLFLAVGCSIRGAKDNPVNRFYQKKKQQSNPLNSKAAKTACTAKLLKIIYGICKNKTTYER